MTTRRKLLAGGAGLLISACASPPLPVVAGPAPEEKLVAIESRVGGRLGVCAIDTGSGALIGHRMDERFAMASTFKWLLVAGILKRSETGLMPLSSTMYYTPNDILPNSPVTSMHIDAIKGVGGLSLEELCEAAITVSDNTAANLLLVPMFGPEGLTYFLREAGDSITRLDRSETELNENTPGDPRDTTTPQAMARSLQRLLATDDVLNAASRQRLIGWMEATSNARDRLRAGLPPDWRAGDKPGTGGNGAYNDVAIVVPPRRRPIVIASYMSESAAETGVLAAAQADVARVIVTAWGS